MQIFVDLMSTNLLYLVVELREPDNKTPKLILLKIYSY